VPIVAVTAHAAEGDAERCLAAGMDAYLAKPLQARDLLATLDHVTGGPRPIAPLPPAAGAPGEPPGARVVDHERLLERVGGDRKALRRLVRVFLEDSPKQLAGIRAALAAGDAPALRAAAHALKGAVANFAAPAAAAAALRLQQLGENSDLSRAPGALSVLAHELQRVRRALSAHTQKPLRPRRSPRAAPKRHAPRKSKGRR
jgi:HPt (histidine-containing phosphotransfer) domain-containing protein